VLLYIIILMYYTILYYIILHITQFNSIIGIWGYNIYNIIIDTNYFIKYKRIKWMLKIWLLFEDKIIDINHKKIKSEMTIL